MHVFWTQTQKNYAFDATEKFPYIFPPCQRPVVQSTHNSILIIGHNWALEVCHAHRLLFTLKCNPPEPFFPPTSPNKQRVQYDTTHLWVVVTHVSLQKTPEKH